MLLSILASPSAGQSSVAVAASPHDTEQKKRARCRTRLSTTCWNTELRTAAGALSVRFPCFVAAPVALPLALTSAARTLATTVHTLATTAIAITALARAGLPATVATTPGRAAAAGAGTSGPITAATALAATIALPIATAEAWATAVALALATCVACTSANAVPATTSRRGFAGHIPVSPPAVQRSVLPGGTRGGAAAGAVSDALPLLLAQRGTPAAPSAQLAADTCGTGLARGIRRTGPFRR